ncbi:Uma2 family endonuclease [Oscillatoria sp. CS-180]|uniref:Uma2 family endonuclease n=1 Tax=Oscillatoria sp. CS-180 TaxID=3021720 RepID=UPI00232ACF82|nr:Uma2 family endonuclease [Oscillatoria sp. CS-180]MDB9528907.1 Uma2 family endonuclease [Oscillatoria sp. CS-180]
MVRTDLYTNLPTSDELPCSDDTPVDNEDQNLLPNYLLFLLYLIWGDRHDWYFGADMAIYHTTGVSPKVPVVPDGFLSVGVPRRKPGNKSRKSYVVWEEDGTVPKFVLEMASWTPGNEYDDKITLYENLGVLYYVIYNPDYWQRDRHQPFEVYKLVDGRYQLQIGEPYWMPEIGLGIGRSQGSLGGIPREILSWFDAQGNRYLSADEQAQQAQQQAQQAQLQVQQERQARLTAIAQLHEMGLAPEQIAQALNMTLEDVNQQLQDSGQD